LLRALINNDTDVARLLLEKGANPNIYGMGLSPWLYAAGLTSGTYNPTRGGGSGGVGTGSAIVDVTLLDLMLARGADVNARVTGAASYSGRIARALTGDPVNTTSNEGMTALHVAARIAQREFWCATCWTRTRARTSTMRPAGRRSMCLMACRRISLLFSPMRMASCRPMRMPLRRSPGRGAGNPQRSKRFGPC
jgi:hypothetical protein